MAQGKKSFIHYGDLINSLEGLTDLEAGLLFKHILRYVNDQNPVCDDRVVNIAFEPIKQQLKRDLKDWETTKEGSHLFRNLSRFNNGHGRNLLTIQTNLPSLLKNLYPVKN